MDLNHQCNIPRILANILRHPVQNKSLFRKCQSNLLILQSCWNFLQLHTSLHFHRLKSLFNFNRTVHKQDFGPKFSFTCHNGAPVADFLNGPHDTPLCHLHVAAEMEEANITDLYRQLGLITSPDFSEKKISFADCQQNKAHEFDTLELKPANWKALGLSPASSALILTV